MKSSIFTGRIEYAAFYLGLQMASYALGLIVAQLFHGSLSTPEGVAVAVTAAGYAGMKAERLFARLKRREAQAALLEGSTPLQYPPFENEEG